MKNAICKQVLWYTFLSKSYSYNESHYIWSRVCHVVQVSGIMVCTDKFSLLNMCSLCVKSNDELSNFSQYRGDLRHIFNFSISWKPDEVLVHDFRYKVTKGGTYLRHPQVKFVFSVHVVVNNLSCRWNQNFLCCCFLFKNSKDILFNSKETVDSHVNFLS